MAQLAIKSHATRGEEVIQILEMLRGKNDNGCNGSNVGKIYFLNDNGYIEGYDSVLFPNHLKLTLEEFLEKFPYKIGDKVILANEGIVTITNMYWDSISEQVVYEGESDTREYDSMNASNLQPYKEQKEETMEEKENSVVVDNKHKQLKVHSLRHDKVQLMINDEYEFKQEGNAYYIIKKQSQHPKTYNECCDILRIPNDERYVDIDVPLHYTSLLKSFTKLLICRDAYWKIAEDWKPDWIDNNTCYYAIATTKGDIGLMSSLYIDNGILVFPTEEMRDAFYENFKELIEECKELL